MTLRLALTAWLAVFAGLVLALSGAGFFLPTEDAASDGRVIDLTSLRWEVAATDEERRVGLSNRSSLADDVGMIFVFDQPGIYPFWMKETRLPLDIVWLRQGRVVDIATLLPPSGSGAIPTHVPLKSADTVIEMKAGQARARGIKLGSVLSITPDHD